MKFTSIKFKGYRCFLDDWAGFDAVKPITVIIGRNNTGKSHLLHLVRLACGHRIYSADNNVKYQVGGIIDDSILQKAFPNSNNSYLGNFWLKHGRYFVDTHISANAIYSNSDNRYEILESPDFFKGLSSQPNSSDVQDRKRIIQSLFNGSHAFCNLNYRRLQADRDINPEADDTELKIESDGAGATNIIRRFILSSSEACPRELIQKEVLESLNKIFVKDGRFTEIQIQQHDEPASDDTKPSNLYEIYLGEEHKKLVSLSNSGSGLKTVFLVLLNLLVIPHIEKKPKDTYVYAFEELENNLHPALLRRLFRYLEEYAVENKVHIFLTTHSSTALDLFSSSDNAQIVSVTHNGKSANAKTISAHFDQLSVIAELGAKPSDLLQANGIIWVEGPSDRVYINKWIQLFSDGKWREGRDYQCAFYGGALLARLGVADPKAEEEFVNLLQINSNLILVCDGDRTAETGTGSRLKERVRKIKKQVESVKNNSYIWITEAKEIENYLPGELLVGEQDGKLKDPGQYERFFPAKKSEKGSSYLESQMGLKSIDKMELALKIAPRMTKEMMIPRFDIEKQITAIVDKIALWNAEGDVE
jgi:putative ATP-dependent endonuclease of OLD family